MACGGAASAPSEEGAGAPKGYKGATEGEITRGRCLHRGADEHRVKKRSFAFSVGYIYCFRTYSVYLSLRLPAQILYAGIHLPPQREARALPRRAQISPQWAASGCHRFRGYDRLRRSALIRLSFADRRQMKSTFPKGKAKRSVYRGGDSKKVRKKGSFLCGKLKREKLRKP